MGLTDLVFSENGCIADRVSNTLLGGAGGVTRELTRFFFTLGARRTGHGARARARLAGSAPRTIPRQSSRAASRSAARARSENTPAVNQNTIPLCYTRLPFGELGSTRGVTQTGMLQGKNDQSPSSGSMRVIPIVRNI